MDEPLSTAPGRVRGPGSPGAPRGALRPDPHPHDGAPRGPAPDARGPDAPDAPGPRGTDPGELVIDLTGGPAAGGRRATAASPPDPESTRPLDRVADLAAAVLGADAARVWSRAGAPSPGAGGLSAGAGLELVAEVEALCADVAATGVDAVVADTAADPRTRELRGGRGAGAAVAAHLVTPVVDDAGVVLGALAVVSAAPRAWTAGDLDLLRRLAASALAELQLGELAGELAAERARWDLALEAAGVGGFDWDLTTGSVEADAHLPRLFEGPHGPDAADGTGRPDGPDAPSGVAGGRGPEGAAGASGGGVRGRAFDGTAAWLAERVHPDDLDRVTRALTTAVERCEGFQVEFRVLTPAGAVRWLEARGRPLPDAGGVVRRVLGAAHDATERHEAEARLGRVLETMSAAFVSLDREMRVDYVNGEAERLLRTPRADLLGRRARDVLAGPGGPALEAVCREAVLADGPRTAEVRGVGARRSSTLGPRPRDAAGDPPGAWLEARAWPGPDGVALYLLDTTERRRAQELAERATTRLTMLADVTAELSGTLDASAAVAQLTRLVVPELADWCVITLVDGAGRPEDVGWWHRDPALRPVLARYAQLRMRSLADGSQLARVLSTGERSVAADGAAVEAAEGLVDGEAQRLLAVLAPAAGAVLPLRARGRTLGLLAVYADAGSDHLARGHLEAAEEVALRAGLALDNARLYDRQRRMAEGLQRSLLTDPPQVEGVELVVRYVPAAEAAQVGGDWYDAFRQVDGALVLVIGDVVGHDTEAAAAMGQLRGLLRGIAYHSGASPSQVLGGLDAAMAGLHVGTTATAVVARLERAPSGPAGSGSGDVAAGVGGARLRWSSAGHPPALVVDRSGWVTELTAWEADVLLGVDASTPRGEAVARLAPGSTVLLYTDGLVERRGQSLDEGLERLRGVVSSLADRPLGELCDEVLARMLPERAEDDVALIALRLDAG